MSFEARVEQRRIALQQDKIRQEALKKQLERESEEQKRIASLQDVYKLFSEVNNYISENESVKRIVLFLDRISKEPIKYLPEQYKQENDKYIGTGRFPLNERDPAVTRITQIANYKINSAELAKMRNQFDENRMINLVTTESISMPSDSSRSNRSGAHIEHRSVVTTVTQPGGEGSLHLRVSGADVKYDGEFSQYTRPDKLDEIYIEAFADPSIGIEYLRDSSDDWRR